MNTGLFPRLILAGTGSGCGKTTVTAALLRAFSAAGTVVQPFKTGPDFIDPMFHQAAAGRTSANLDSWLLSPDTIQQLFRQRMADTGADLALIEGVMGLYDGLADTQAASTAELAGILNAPVVLLVDGSGLSLSICAVIQGFQHFDETVGQRIAGVILNRIPAASVASLQEMIERHCGIPVLGSLPRLPDCQLDSRHLGLVPAAEDPELERKLQRLAEQARLTVDLPALMALAATAAPLTWPDPAPYMPDNAAEPDSCCRIGVARDLAFNFYYEDNLDLLRRLGAELVFFSPLDQPQLPDNLDGLYLGGGYPEMFAARLSANTNLRRQIREQVRSGLPTVAECGGFLYLGETLQDQHGQCHAMCGAVPAHVVMTGRLQHFGYQTLTLGSTGLLGHPGDQIRVHEFHYSASDADGQDCQAVKPDGRSWRAVHHGPSSWIGYPHLHFYSQPGMAANWLRQCRLWREQRIGGASYKPEGAGI